jgi:hypothetical protein
MAELLVHPMTQPHWAILQLAELGLATRSTLFIEQDAIADRQRSTYCKLGRPALPLVTNTSLFTVFETSSTSRYR